jgi:short-subunit dehydrogenase
MNRQERSVSGKSVLITGGTTGIGRATALLLAKEGAHVMIFGRHLADLDNTLNDVKRELPNSHIYGMLADVSESEDIQRVFNEVDGILGPIDILINNAGLGYNSISEGDYAEWQYIINTNLLGYMACAHEAIKRMELKHNGHIINIGSMSADVKEANSSVYVATKSGINGFTTSLRKEVNQKGIKVTLIEPGAVNTEMQPESLVEKEEKVDKMEMLQAEDIAHAVLYALLQTQRCDIVLIQIRPHLQLI